MADITSTIQTIARQYFGDYRVRGDEVVAEYCPFCHGGNSGDRNTFAVNMTTGGYNCRRGSCNVTGGIRDLIEYLGCNLEAPVIPAALGKRKKTIVKPDPEELQPVTEEILTYFMKRGISPQTVYDFEIAADSEGNIVFPFKLNGVLTFVKYRKPRKIGKEDGPKEWQMKNTEPILFGMDNVSFKKPLVITEGEIDAMAVYEAGYHNVVSVPCGCDNLTWLDTCKQWLDNISTFILMGDSDEPGMRMIKNLVDELGKDRCMVPPEYPPIIIDGQPGNRICKDANEILFCYGPEGLKAVIDQCEEAPVEGILDLADVPRKDWASVPKIYTRIPGLDNMIGGLAEGTVTILSGKRGEGKSTISGEFMLNAIEQGYNVAMYSGELDSSEVREWIMLQATETRYISATKDRQTGQLSPTISPEIETRIADWMRGHFYLYDNTMLRNKSETDAVLEMFTVCARRYGAKLFVIDNLMSILRSPDEENKAQARFTAEVKAFAMRYRAIVVMVCHPRKEKADTKFSNDSVSGSSAITNLADTVLNIEKPNIRCTKNRHNGITGLVECSYDPANRRIFETISGDRIVYSWNHTGLVPYSEDDPAAAIHYKQFAIQTGQPEGNGFTFAA